MIVYKYFLKSALKQKWIIISYTALFFVLSLISSAGRDENETIFMEQSLDIGIVDESNSKLSKSMIDYLSSNNNINIMENNIEDLKEEVFLRTVDAVVIIPKDFESLVIDKKEAVEIILDDRAMQSIQVKNEINKFLIFANATYRDDTFDLEKVNSVLEEHVEVELLEINKDQNIDNIKSWFNGYFNFTGYVLIAIYVAVMGFIMLEFNDKKIQARIKVSAKKFLNFNIEIYLGQITLAILITMVFILGAVVLKGKYISEVQFSKYLLNISVFSFSILGLTFLINNLTSSRFTINAISTVVSLGTAFISGVMISQEFLGEKVLGIAKFFPTYYFVKINGMEINSFSDIRYEIFIQILFGIAFLLMGLYFSKIKQKS